MKYNTKQTADFLHFILYEVEEILLTLGDILKKPDIVSIPVKRNTNIRSFFQDYNPIASDEIIRTLGDRLGIQLEPAPIITMGDIAMKLR